MENVFLELFNMSITASWLVIAVIVFRFLFKKAPKSLRVIMWGLVALRLVCPFSLESVLSIIPSTEFVPSEIVYSDSSADVSGAEIFNAIGNNPVNYDLGIQDGSVVFTEYSAPDGNTVNPLLIITYIASIVWVVGMAVMLLYTLISYLRILKKVREATPLKENIWICDNISTPFILGLVKPRIFLPSSMNEQDTEFVIAHEKAHLKRRDHFWKHLGFALLKVYWFNPVLWIAYILLCKDIELACDEKATKNYEPSQKAGYTQALLYFSVPKNSLFICPFSFSESGIKNRIKSVLNYKKPAFWLILVSVIATIVVSILVFSNPAKPNTEKPKEFDLDTAVSQAIKDYNHPDEPDTDIVTTESHFIYGKEKNGNQLTVYLNANYQCYTNDNPLGIVEEDGGGCYPCAITFEVNADGSYNILEYWVPEDGTYYASSIKEKFPPVYAHFAISNFLPPPNPDTTEVYEHFNAPKYVTFSHWDYNNRFSDKKAEVTLTLNTETSYATLKVDGKEILTDHYSIFNFDENGNKVPEEYIYLCDVDNLPNNSYEYCFNIANENTLYVSNLPEGMPVFTRVEE